MKMGVVKWFGNKRTGVQEGFVAGLDSVDHYFHKTSIVDQSYVPKQDDIVWFDLRPSRKRSGEFEAVRVEPLSSISDAETLVDACLPSQSTTLPVACRQRLAKRIGEICDSDNARQGVANSLAAYLAATTGPPPFSHRRLCDIIAIAPAFGMAATPIVAFMLDGSGVLESLTQALCLLPVGEAKPSLLHLFTVCREHAPKCERQVWDILRIHASPALRVICWVEAGGPHHPSLEDLRATYAELTKDDRQSCQRRVFEALGRDELDREILIALGHSACQPPMDMAKVLLHELVVGCRQYAPECEAELWDVVSQSGKGVLQVLLWLDTETLQHPSLTLIRASCAILDHKQQQLCFKRLFKSMRSLMAGYTAPDVLDLPWSDPSTCIVVATIKTMLAGQTMAEKKVYDALLESIHAPDQAVDIDGYFDNCKGRAYCLGGEDMDSDAEPKAPPTIRREERKPKGIKFCEGRIYKDKKGTPIRDRKHGVQFWMCHGRPCFETSVCETIPDDWREYTLLHCLMLAGVECSADSYQVLLGTLNRLRQMVEHLICRKCGHLLHPVGSSSYAFYRVTRFACNNDECGFKDEIYLNHCLNPKCFNVAVDSRDSAKCSCGWYVCDYCLACCTTEKLAQRHRLRTERGDSCEAPVEGHYDRREICCPRCGSLLRSADERSSFVKAVEWLRKNKNDRKCIVKSGVSLKYGHWYLVKQSSAKSKEEFNSWLKKFAAAGFSVPSINEDKEVQLVGEPSREVIAMLKCPKLRCDNEECGFEVDLWRISAEHDFDRLNALRFHAVIAEALPKPGRIREHDDESESGG